MKSTILSSSAIAMLLLATACGAGSGSPSADGDQAENLGTISLALSYNSVAVPHNNTTKRVFMHYMPWFEANGVEHGYTRTGSYGYHWKFNTCGDFNGNGLLDHATTATGDRVCAMQRPIIGPYSSSDPFVIEYHLLLMKYSGVDGVSIDWGGAMNVGDLPGNKINGEALINRVNDFGLNFMVIMEDRNYQRDNEAGVADSWGNIHNDNDDIADAAADLRCLSNGSNCGVSTNMYFGNSRYERFNGAPLLGVFGPVFMQDGWKWESAYAQAGLNSSSTYMLSLHWQTPQLGNVMDGSFSWFWQGTSSPDNVWRNYQQVQTHYNADHPYYSVKMGAIFPSHDTYYTEGGAWNDASEQVVSFNGGAIVEQTADIALGSADNYVQLVTFNDFGEGTNFEPSEENQYTALTKLQSKLGVPYGVTQLQLIKRLFDERVAARKNNDATRQAQLDDASKYLAARDVSAAQCIIDGCAATGASSPLVANANYEIMSVNSTKCLDVPNGTWGSGLTYDQKACDQSNAQRFQLWVVGDGTYYIVNTNNWQCLDTTGGLTQQTCNWTINASPQHFYIGDWGTGQMDIRSQTAGTCVDVSGMSKADGAHTGLWTCNGQMNQRWILRSVKGDMRHVWANMCGEPSDGSSNPVGNTALDITHDCAHVDRLRYTLRNDGNLQHVSSGECLHPLGGVALDQKQVVFYPACGYDSIAFRQLPNGSLQHKQSGLCLARPGSETADHTPLILQMNCNVPFSLDP